MPELQQSAGKQPPARRSRLVPWGVVLVALGLLAPRPIQAVAAGMAAGGLSGLLFIATDVFRLGFFVGIAFLIIGVLRNRRWKREAGVSPPSVQG
jgi:hypothetical protein